MMLANTKNQYHRNSKCRCCATDSILRYFSSHVLKKLIQLKNSPNINKRQSCCNRQLPIQPKILSSNNSFASLNSNSIFMKSGSRVSLLFRAIGQQPEPVGVLCIGKKMPRQNSSRVIQSRCGLYYNISSRNNLCDLNKKEIVINCEGI